MEWKIKSSQCSTKKSETHCWLSGSRCTFSPLFFYVNFLLLSSCDRPTRVVKWDMSWCWWVVRGWRRPKTSTLLSWNFISILSTHCAETSTIPFIISAIHSRSERAKWSGKILFFFIGRKNYRRCLRSGELIHTLAQKNNQLFHPLCWRFFPASSLDSPTANVISVRSRVVEWLCARHRRSPAK